MLQKIRFFDKKDPKLSLSELLSWMTIFKSIHMGTENDNNFGYEKITILVDNIPLRCETTN
jgi:hypothetical protein